MSGTRIKRRLREAQRLWERARQSGDALGIPGFLDGVKRGFQEALRIVDEEQRGDVRVKRDERQPLSRWNGVLLYRACQQAYRRLVISDRMGAMRILQRALGRVSVRGPSPKIPN